MKSPQRHLGALSMAIALAAPLAAQAAFGAAAPTRDEAAARSVLQAVQEIRALFISQKSFEGVNSLPINSAFVDFPKLPASEVAKFQLRALRQGRAAAISYRAGACPDLARLRDRLVHIQAISTRETVQCRGGVITVTIDKAFEAP